MSHRLQELKKAIYAAYDIDYYQVIHTENNNYKVVIVSSEFDEGNRRVRSISDAVDGIITRGISFMPLGTKEFDKIIKKATFNGF